MLAPNKLSELYTLVQEKQDKSIEGPVHAALVRRMSPKDLIKAIARFQHNGKVLNFFTLRELAPSELAQVSPLGDLEQERDAPSPTNPPAKRAKIEKKPFDEPFIDEQKIASPRWYLEQAFRFFRKIPDNLPLPNASSLAKPNSP